MEQGYINEILAGNPARFSYFVETYKNLAFSIAFRITENKEDAEEVVQDAFLKAYQNLQDFRRDAKFSTWFYKIAVNTALTKIRKTKMPLSELDEELAGFANIQELDAAYSALQKEEQQKFINAALDTMSVEDRLLLTLYYLGENTIEEISEITGIIPENIKMKLHRARRKMFCALQNDLKTEIHSLL